MAINLVSKEEMEIPIKKKEISILRERKRISEEAKKERKRISEEARSNTSMGKNIHCPIYLGVVVEKYLLTCFKKATKVEFDHTSNKKPVDWIYEIGNEKIKIKQLSSCSLVNIDCDGHGYDREYFHWGIRQNYKTDVFILSAWSSRENPELLYVWAIGAHEIINGKEFWNRKTFDISNHNFSLDKFSEFLISNNGIENIETSFEERYVKIKNCT